MALFHRSKISFEQQDPLANGLSDEISAEQHEAESFVSLDDVSGDELSESWTKIVKDAKKDPDWFTFDNN